MIDAQSTDSYETRESPKPMHKKKLSETDDLEEFLYSYEKEMLVLLMTSSSKENEN